MDISACTMRVCETLSYKTLTAALQKVGLTSGDSAHWKLQGHLASRALRVLESYSLVLSLPGSDQQDLDLSRVRTPVSFSDTSFRHRSRTAEHCCIRFSVFGFRGGNSACCKSKTETNTKESSESPCNICASRAVGKYSSTWDHILNELQDQEN